MLISKKVTVSLTAALITTVMSAPSFADNGNSAASSILQSMVIVDTPTQIQTNWFGDFFAFFRQG